MKRHAALFTSMLFCALLAVGCGGDYVQTLLNNPEAQGKIMDAISANTELAGKMMDKFMASDSVRAVVMDKLMADELPKFDIKAELFKPDDSDTAKTKPAAKSEAGASKPPASGVKPAGNKGSAKPN